MGTAGGWYPWEGRIESATRDQLNRGGGSDQLQAQSPQDSSRRGGLNDRSVSTAQRAESTEQ